MKPEIPHWSERTASTNSCLRVNVWTSSSFSNPRASRWGDTAIGSLVTRLLICPTIDQRAQSPSGWTLSNSKLNLAKFRCSVCSLVFIVGWSLSKMESSTLSSLCILSTWIRSRALNDRSMLFLLTFCINSHTLRISVIIAQGTCSLEILYAVSHYDDRIWRLTVRNFVVRINRTSSKFSLFLMLTLICRLAHLRTLRSATHW